jgi:phenylacetate-CoA ligase
MRPQTLLSALYGEARGYRRLSIRRQVAANEHLSRATLAINSNRLFQEHVQRSIGRFPIYAERVKAHRGSLPKPGQLVRPEELPVWTRRDQIDFFAAQERPADAHYVHETGGSTGLVVRLHVTRESYEWRTAIADRAYGWAGAEEGARSLHIWGASKPKSRMHRYKVLVHRALQQRTFFDAYRQFTDEERAACCELINRMRPQAIVGYTGILVDIARFAREHNALQWKARTLVSTAETLQCGQRELLESQLAQEVFDSYGSREFMNIASECSMHDGYHIASDNVFVEVVDKNGKPVEAGTEGRIVVTDFHNATTPFVRYDLGDMGVMAPTDRHCRCGRPFPLLQSVEGRAQDVIHTRHGWVTAISLLDVLEHFDWVEGYQCLQPSREQLVIKLLTRVELSEERLRPLRAYLHTQITGLDFTFERVNELSRGSNGKIELVSRARDVA